MNEFQHFLDCIENNEVPFAPAEHGVYFMNIVDAFYQSAISSKPYLFEKVEEPNEKSVLLS
ncbi:hypothetical protein D3C84_1280810 [compost metagenome]